MPMYIDTFETTVTGLVSEHIEEVMLGIDWLTTEQYGISVMEKCK